MPRTESPTKSFKFRALALCSVLLLSGCHILNAQRTLSQARQELARAEQIELTEENLYHRAMARGLIEAAEKQYEDADFSETVRFAREALEHLARIPGESGETSGDFPPGGANEATP